MAFLELHGVAKGYGDGEARADVVRNLNLSVAKGEFVAIVGYSGAGKTTLISMIAGLLAPDRGQVTIGRGSDSHVKLDDPLASRRHAILRVDAGRFHVQDAGSANGIRVRDDIGGIRQDWRTVGATRPP